LISAVSMFGAAWMSGVLTVDRDIEAVSLLRFRFVVAAAAMLVVSRFMLDTFNLGQVNAIVAAFAVSHLYLFSRGRKVLSAMALVLAVSIKLTPALLIVYHIAKLRLKYAAACVAILAAVTALSFLPFESHGVAAFRAFANRTLKNEQGYNLADTGNQSLRAAIARLVDPEAGSESRSPGEPVSAGLAIILLVAAVFSASRAQSEIAGGASFFCCMVLLSPLSWKAHFVMLVLPIAFLFSLAFNPQTSAIQRRIIVLALLVCFVLLNLTSPRIIGLAAAECADAHSFVTIAALIVCVAVICSASHKFGKQQRVC
jgi:Glycosyltransferase family 87